MNSIMCFTDMDSLFDARRGIITKVALESGNTKFDWDRNFAEVYKRRRFDFFNQPELGVTHAAYRTRFAKRSIADFEDDTQVFIRPSKLIKNLFSIAREIEFGVGQMISAGTFSLTVNLFPYELSDDMLQELNSVIRGAVPFNISLSFVSIPHEEILPAVLHSYHYVFLYGFLNSPDYKTYWDNYVTSQQTNTRFIVPDVLAKSEEELPPEMKSEELINLIGKLNVTQGGKITWVPYPKTIFDYVE
ncbi:hypothetical protein PQD71_gp209 [Kosakonia phage Kc263]|uniref:Uncharacterized protein n=1 Tax=Kosakonia phage Kc263 TaxID=2863194 RepID=A0AAE7WFH7_9CAUD|nr:hypothetical protein PQD71_gp209 [Kosakonia phage Kc263]QYN80117.1 hypothetical protein [Kosakonia phage Kc263]